MSLKDKLKALEDELQAALAKSDKVAKLKTEITALKKLISDQESSENQYTKEYAGVVQDQTKKQAASDAQSGTVQKNTSANDRKRVDTEVAEVKSKIDELTKQLKTASDAADAAAKASAAAKEATKQAQGKLVDLKEPWKPAQKALKEVDALIASVDQEIQSKNYPVAYFLVNDTQDKLKTVSLDKPDKYNDNLAKMTDAVSEAAAKEQEAKDALDQKTLEKNTAQKAVDDAMSKRQDTIIRRINEGTSEPAPARTGETASVTGDANP